MVTKTGIIQSEQEAKVSNIIKKASVNVDDTDNDYTPTNLSQDFMSVPG